MSKQEAALGPWYSGDPMDRIGLSISSDNPRIRLE